MVKLYQVKGSNSKNDKLTNNYSSGFVYMTGGKGNDTYTVNTIGSTWTEIDDIGFQYGNENYFSQKYGKDTLVINKFNGNNILFFFDVTNGSYMPADDGLYIINKSMQSSVINQLKNFLSNGTIPTKGGIDIPLYFGDTNDGGSTWGANRIENINVVSSSGVTYQYNLNSYISTVTSKVRDLLDETGYNSALEILTYGNTTTLNKLTKIYSDTPLNYTITGTSKADKISGGAGNDTIKGSAGDDILKGGNGKDVIYGGTGKDTIDGGSGNDVLKGEDGNDILKAGAGYDKITAGKGNDTIYFQKGDNTAYFTSGDGNDTVISGTGSDVLQFNNFANSSKLKSGITVSKSGSDLKLAYTSKDSVTLSGFFKNGTSVESLVAKDNSAVELETLLKSKTFSLSGKSVTGTKYNDIIKGTTGADSLSGGAGNDKITAGKGNDTINGGKGTNYLYFAKNDGKDTVISGGGSDTLVFTNEKLANIKAKYSGNNVVLSYTGGTITLKDYLKGGHSAQTIQVGSTKKTIESMLPYNKVKRTGLEYIGTNKKDSVESTIQDAVIKTYTGDDKIEIIEKRNLVTAGKGNDIITNYSYRTNYYFNSGDGNDTIKSIPKQDHEEHWLILNNENNLSGLTFKKNNNGYTITYNGGKDSIKYVMTNTVYNNWQNFPDFSYEDYLNYDGVIKTKNAYGYISPNGIMNYYTDYVYNAGENWETEYQGLIDNLTTTNQADYVYAIQAKVINTQGGNDYINVYDTSYYENDDYYQTEIYAGKGNDIIGASSGAKLYFSNGDGNDIVYNASNTYVFSDAESIDEIELSWKDSKNFVLGYNNNKDSINIKISNTYGNLADKPTGYIQVGEDIYSILGTNNYYNDIAGILGTQGDDVVSVYNANKTFILRNGNDTINITNEYYDDLIPYFNIKADGSYTDKSLYMFDENSFEIKDYFDKNGTTTLVNKETNETLYQLDTLDNFNEIKSAVAGWLSSNGYTDVQAAITDGGKSYDNIQTLTGAEYFGGFDWQSAVA